MTEPIFEPSYWQRRLEESMDTQPHRAVYHCPPETWDLIEVRHKELLLAHIGDGQSVLDAGCGWGRLLNLLPASWRGDYLGVDLSPDFIRMARSLHPALKYLFMVGDLRTDLGQLKDASFDWAILISIRPMVVRNAGDGEWDKIKAGLNRVTRRQLYLEYDPEDQGVVEP